MFVFEFDAASLTLRQNRPAFAPLLQLPPLLSHCPSKIGEGYMALPSCLIHAPTILPISFVCRIQTSSRLVLM